jgi:uncharacterized membrane protein
MSGAAASSGVDMAVSQWLKLVGLGIEVLAAAVIVIGLAWSTWLFLRRRMVEEQYDTYKIRVGRSLLLGLEIVVAADIVKTIAVEPTLMSLAVLAGLVLIRTFLSWTLVLEIEGRWPWLRDADRLRPPGRSRALAAGTSVDPVR